MLWVWWFRGISWFQWSVLLGLVSYFDPWIIQSFTPENKRFAPTGNFNFQSSIFRVQTVHGVKSWWLINPLMAGHIFGKIQVALNGGGLPLWLFHDWKMLLLSIGLAIPWWSDAWQNEGVLQPFLSVATWHIRDFPGCEKPPQVDGGWMIWNFFEADGVSNWIIFFSTSFSG